MPANENRIKTYKNKGRDVDVSIIDNWKWIDLNDINFEVYKVPENCSSKSWESPLI